MDKCLNQYGDVLRPTSGAHGADISSQRIDQLDWECLQEAVSLLRQETGVTVVDIGAGYGAQSLRLATFGASVWMYELLDRKNFVDEANRLLGRKLLSSKQGDVQTLSLDDLPDSISLAYSQRFLHYLPFPAAVKLLTVVRERMTPSAKFFLSASGLNSELGNDYPGQGRVLADRFARLAPAMASKHQILDPVCLYDESDFEILAGESGFRVEVVSRSAFGNIKCQLAQ